MLRRALWMSLLLTLSCAQAGTNAEPLSVDAAGLGPADAAPADAAGPVDALESLPDAQPPLPDAAPPADGPVSRPPDAMPPADAARPPDAAPPAIDARPPVDASPRCGQINQPCCQYRYCDGDEVACISGGCVYYPSCGQTNTHCCGGYDGTCRQPSDECRENVCRRRD